MNDKEPRDNGSTSRPSSRKNENLTDCGTPVHNHARKTAATEKEILLRLESEKALQESEAKLIEAQRLAGMGDCTWDLETGEVTWSDALFELLGHEKSETFDYVRVNREIHHPDDLERVTRWLNECIASGMNEIRSNEYRVVRKDGKTLYVRIVCKIRHRSGKKPVIFATVQDISERRQALDETKRNADRLEAVVEILQYSSTQSLQDFLDLTLEKALALTTSRLGYIFFYDDNRREFTLNTWSGNVMTDSVGDHQTCYELDTKGIWGEAVRQRRPIVINDFQAEHPHKKGYPKGHVHVTRLLTVPILHGESIVAVVGVANKPSDYDKTDELELNLLLNAVWNSLEVKRRDEALRRIEWLLTSKTSAESEPCIPLHGDPASMNASGLIFNSVSKPILTDILSESIDLLETSANVFEQNGDYALSILSSGWCRLLNNASRQLCGTEDDREAIAGGKWLCHESCWSGAGKIAVETGQAVDAGCLCGLDVHAVPIRAGGIAGAVTLCFGDPPHDSAGIRKLADQFKVSEKELRRQAKAYETRPPFIIEVAKKRLAASARLTGEIIQRRGMEEALRESEKQYRILFDNNPLPMWVYDLETLRILAVNPATLERYGYTEEEFLGMTIKDIRPREDVPALLENVSQVTDGLDNAGIWRHLKKDGTIIFVEVTSHTLTFNDRRAELVLAYDVTERKRAQNALVESEEKFRSLFHNHAAVKLLLDPGDGSIVDANDAAVRFYGWSRHELLNMKIFGINTLPPQVVQQKMEEVLKSKNLHFEFNHRKADGTVADVEVFSSSVNIGGREFLHSIVHDITEHRRLEEQYYQAQKMESVGRLAGGVAHDFNNMLSVIICNADMAMDRVTESDPLYNDLRDILYAAKRSADITRQLLAFARKQTVSPRVLDLGETVQGMLKMLRRLIGEDIDLVWLPGPKAGQVLIDPSQIDQILANLCINASDAINGVGKIFISLDNAVMDEAYCSGHKYFKPGDYVVLNVSDTGCGMDKDILSKIFEPFFSTKKVGQGTGLGLATVFGIIKQNNGFINVYSEPGHGTTFKMYLPRHAGKPALVEKREDIKVSMGSGETVLLVEDEAALLELAKRMLKSLGYNVLSAAAPTIALRIASQHEGKIDLLLTDIIMPELSGRDLAELMQSQYPGLKLLYMSGYTSDIIANRGVLEHGAHFIQKPFSKNDLAIKIRQILQEGESG